MKKKKSSDLGRWPKKSRPERRRDQRKRRVAINKLREVGVYEIGKWKIGGTPNGALFKEFRVCFGEGIDTYIKRLDRENINNGAEVYIIGSLHYGFVKIGYSKNVSKRLKSIQTGCPFELDVIARFPGTVEVEKSLHEKYEDYRVRGEWFRYEGKLKEAIENIINTRIYPK